MYSLEYLNTLTTEELNELIERRQAAIEYLKTHKLFTFKPYDYQKRFYDAGATYKQRYLRAGNRTGKTYGAAYEMAMHLTGLYPDWWQGERVTGSGHRFACIGISLDSVAKVMQKELFGVEDARVKSELGRGAIPIDHIELDEGWNSDGAVIRSCKIKSVYGGYNTIMFYGSNNIDALMGLTLKGVWLDEEPPFNSLELYSQAVTRTATTGGFVMLTATPEQGMTPLNKMYETNEDKFLYLQSVSWDECPHITPEIAKQLLAGIAKYQHDMRMKGLPVLGQGAVFQYDETDLMVQDVNYRDDWLICGAIDIGHRKDPSVVSFAVCDPSFQHYYLLHQIYLDQDRSSRAIADAIKASPFPNALIVVPHDGGGEAPEATSNQLEYFGINTFKGHFNNPTETRLGFKIPSGKGVINHRAMKEPGLSTMRFYFDEGYLKVHQSCNEWFKEMRSYYYKPNNGIQEPTGPDHCIDSSRYAFMSLLNNRYTTIAQAKNINSNQFNSFHGFNF